MSFISSAFIQLRYLFSNISLHIWILHASRAFCITSRKNTNLSSYIFAPSITSNAFSGDIEKRKSVSPCISGTPFKSNSHFPSFGALPTIFSGIIFFQLSAQNSTSSFSHVRKTLVSRYTSGLLQSAVYSIISGVIRMCLADICFSQ